MRYGVGAVLQIMPATGNVYVRAAEGSGIGGTRTLIGYAVVVTGVITMVSGPHGTGNASEKALMTDITPVFLEDGEVTTWHEYARAHKDSGLSYRVDA
jgi:hypothetical protein